MSSVLKIYITKAFLQFYALVGIHQIHSTRKSILNLNIHKNCLFMYAFGYKLHALY